MRSQVISNIAIHYPDNVAMCFNPCICQAVSTGTATPAYTETECDGHKMRIIAYHGKAVWDMRELLQLAVTLASSEETGQMEAMELLRCRTAPEVLAGALYACITCHGDFDAAMITAVNHSGRSAAVGAVTGAALGIKMGEGALPEFYLESLEPAKLLRELADDLAQGNPADRVSTLFDDDWDRKYLHGGV